MSEPYLPELPVDVTRIMGILPHRYPFLLVDRVIELEPRARIRAIKNVSINEPFFQGHFPGHPVMPGVLVIEALAQASGLLTQLSEPPKPKGEEAIFYLVRVDKARFARTVVPGDQLVLESVQKRMRLGMGLYECAATVDGREVACCEVLCAERAS
ncbi:MAG: 3-hydroxyacyl-ACP dehydratase FabZ [Xanthomonadales bacterium]|jgi:3-hydroxyacyl-[acyl-carrier-protein] dehydratase|nr:3-hydroxyacyl-ACP dehydratase FabZ [Xanthomonadales bacterium]